MRFKNLKSGNFVSTEDPKTIALMKKSPNYEEAPVKKAKSKGKDDPDAKPDPET